MARKPNHTEIIDLNDESIDQPKVAGAMALMRQTAASTELALSQHESAVRAVAASMGYQLPADCTDADLIQRDIAANMRRSVEACLQVGMGLRVLKAACQHGEFMARLDVLGIEGSVARRFMDASSRFSKRASTHVLGAAGSQTKLFEMLVLDDEQIEELELTGQTGELSLDDVASMSCKELRAKLREARAEKQAVERVLQTKNQQIDKLQLVQVLPPDQLFDELVKKASSITVDALGAIRGGVRASLVAINAHGGRGTNDVVMAGLVGQLQAELNALREEFNLPDVSNAADAALAAEMAQWSN